MTRRLSHGTLSELPAAVARPAFDPARHGAGIVHVGVGAFHRAHQAVYTDTALAAQGGDWRIDGISLRSTRIADELNPQDGLFTLIEREGAEAAARVIGSLRRVIAAARAPQDALEALAAPETRIVSLTVTEKAYGIDRARGTVDERNPAIAADLAAPHRPAGVLGLLFAGLRLRRERGLAPFTVLCCDNLPENGALLRMGLVDFAARIDPAMARWIDEAVAFPSTMVDRITPAPTEATRALAEQLLGMTDLAAVEAEPFSQWVIEDEFSAGRPAWEAAGAIFTDDVAPYEAMKLRMLNGTHSMMAYWGFLAGHRYVRDVMRDRALSPLVRRHMAAAAATLTPLPGIGLDAYAEALARRFANPAIGHELYQIAMDGSEKLPQRIVAPALEALERRQPLRPFAFAVAGWMRYCLGRRDDGTPHGLRDPREAQISAAVRGIEGDPKALFLALCEASRAFPRRLTEHPLWQGEVVGILARALERGVAATLRAEAEAAATG
ncbi:fructuronate reductase [Meinhardsimonia xiamenensis]|jgi:fructuronate reductase|uniref:Fructuronate reductase n=1 Tax=Meinhardsimonia xiamenensis TaxID=990712 RepID=A0A1G9FNY1_9RHOB|nr:mannitol dehydrogenase family protein [Meinhardsimonia xiamenensis]PRX37752.1 fructuronate reductase [Meinhardsimonia xiamenensis]SDK90081.1 fructuronate reductase [Meinhardsimonia xiamenensis]